MTTVTTKITEKQRTSRCPSSYSSYANGHNTAMAIESIVVAKI